MSFLRPLGVLVVSSLCLEIVSAADSACSGTVILETTADSEALAACKTFTGDITIATSAAGDFSLDGIEEITGTLTAADAAELLAISADSLQRVGCFNATGLTVLSSLNLPKWTSADAAELRVLPALSNFEFSTGLRQLDSLDVENTFLASLDGIELSAEVATITISDNAYLQDIRMPVERVTDYLGISGNGDMLRVALEKLEAADYITIRDASTVEVPALTSIGGQLLIDYQSGAKSSHHLDLSKLETVSGDLTIMGESELTSIDLSALRSVGGYLTISGTNVSVFDFPSLETVNQSIFLYGVFSEIRVPAIESVNAVDIKSPNFPSNDSTPADIAWLDAANGIVKSAVAVNSASSTFSTASSSTSASASRTDAGAAAAAAAATTATTDSASAVSSVTETPTPTTVAADSGSSRILVGAVTIGGVLAASPIIW